MALDTTKNAKVNIEVDASMEVKNGVAQVRLSTRDGNLLYFKSNGMLSLKKITPVVENISGVSININTSQRSKKTSTSTSTKKYTVWAPDGSGDQLQVGNGGVIYRVKSDGTYYAASQSDKDYANSHNTWANPSNYNSDTRKNMSGDWGGTYTKSNEVEVSYDNDGRIVLN